MNKAAQNKDSSTEFSVGPCGESGLLQILSRYTSGRGVFVCADSVKLLVDGGQTLSEMLEAISQAERTIDLETYMIVADGTGRRFLEALQRASQRGVSVRVLYDYIGSMELPNWYVNELVDAGVEVRVFHPVVITRPTWAINRRDHRKLLIADEKTTFTGGLNISDDYAAAAEGGKGWRDTHIRIGGHEAARAALGIFEYGWHKGTPWGQTQKKSTMLRAGLQRLRKLRRLHRLRHPISMRKLFSRRTTLPVCGPNDVAVQLLGNREFRLRRLIHNAYLHAINNAEHYILIENAYFIPGTKIRRALARAVRRGVKVAVVLTRDSDRRLAAYASRSLYSSLLSSGVRIFEWPTTMIHAKTAVIDDVWAIVGSYNFDYRSLFHNLEVAAVIADSAFARTLREQTITDISRGIEVTLERHRSRPWYQKAVEPMAHLLRKWL